VFGHIHEGHGVLKKHGTRFVNASTCDISYIPNQKPIVFELPAKGEESLLDKESKSRIDADYLFKERYIDDFDEDEEEEDIKDHKGNHDLTDVTFGSQPQTTHDEVSYHRMLSDEELEASEEAENQWDKSNAEDDEGDRSSLDVVEEVTKEEFDKFDEEADRL